MKLPLVKFERIDPNLLPPNPGVLPRTVRRFTELLSNGSRTSHAEALRTWSLDFFLSPTSFNPAESDPNHIGSMSFSKTRLTGDDLFDSSARVSATEQQVSLPASLAFRSIGYRAEALPGMQDVGITFDTQSGTILNDGKGRIITEDPETNFRLPGMYCSGWVKRGPTGVIASTMEDAFATAAVIAEDWETRAPFLKGGDGWQSLHSEVTTKDRRFVSWDDWQRIDAAEKREGSKKDKEREKLTKVEEMLKVLE